MQFGPYSSVVGGPPAVFKRRQISVDRVANGQRAGRRLFAIIAGGVPLERTLLRTSQPGAFSAEKLALYRSAWDRDGAYGKMVNWYRASARHESPYTGPVRRIAIPTLVAVAADDAFIPGDMTRRSVELLDQGRLLELGYGTHWVLQEEPEKTARIVADFCAEP